MEVSKEEVMNLQNNVLGRLDQTKKIAEVLEKMAHVALGKCPSYLIGV